MELHEAFEAIEELGCRINYEVIRDDGSKLLAGVACHEIPTKADDGVGSNMLDVIMVEVMDYTLEVRTTIRLVAEPVPVIKVHSIRTSEDKIPLFDSPDRFRYADQYAKGLILDIAKHYVQATKDKEELMKQKKADAEDRIRSFLAKMEEGSD